MFAFGHVSFGTGQINLLQAFHQNCLGYTDQTFKDGRKLAPIVQPAASLDSFKVAPGILEKCLDSFERRLGEDNWSDWSLQCNGHCFAQTRHSAFVKTAGAMLNWLVIRAWSDSIRILACPGHPTEMGSRADLAELHQRSRTRATPSSGKFGLLPFI